MRVNLGSFRIGTIVALLIVVGLLTVPIVATIARASGPGPTFNDGDFANWSIATFPNPGSSASHAIASGGNPGNLLRVTHDLGPVGKVRSVHINNNAGYTPSSQGAIQSLDHTEQVRTFETEYNTYGGSTGAALRQNGKYYVSYGVGTRTGPPFPKILPGGTPSPWMTVNFFGLTAANFVRVIGPTWDDGLDGGDHPDFSSSGSIIHFGFTNNQTHTGSTQRIRKSDHDNWSLHITQAPPDFDGDGLPDATDPEPFGQHADPTFSQVPNAPDGVCICTPPMMNNQGGEIQRPGPQVQDWFVKDDGDGSVDVTLTLSVVNPLEAGFHTMRVFDSTNTQVAGPLRLQYHSDINLPALDDTVGSLSVTGATGEVYRVELTVEGDPANNPVPGPFLGDPPTPGVEVVARHYDLKFKGAISAAMGSPSLRQIEAAPATWYLNLDAGETPEVRVSSAGLTAGAGMATIELRNSVGTVVASASPTGGIFDELLTASAPATAEQWSLSVSGLDHHYWVDKLSGSDRGIYATWLTFGFGAIAVDLGGFSGSVGLDIDRLGPGATGSVFSGTYPGPLPLLDPGEYRVTVTPPPGFEVTPTSVDIFVSCKATTQVQFQLEALPPPPSGADPRTIGYWKNHQDHIQDLIDEQPIGGLIVADIVDILRNANAKDARNALRAQRMATVLNLRNGTDPGGILITVGDARAFLLAHAGDPVTRKHPDRDEALDMKDLLDAYNNSGE
jgi:hypothetical protein